MAAIFPLNEKKILRLFLLFLSFSLLFSNTPAQAAIGRKAMVVTADPHASAAALETLQLGGNAVDAAIAAQWMLNVVEPASSGIGGGGFFLYYEAATKRVYFFDGREKAPAAAYPEMFLDKHGKPYEFYPDAITGGLAVGVPGTLKLLYEVKERFGSKAFAFRELFNPAIDIAEKGFPISPRLATYIEQERKRLKKFPASKAIFLNKKGKALKAGEILVQEDLAKTFRIIQKEGIQAFYEGEIAKAIVDAVRNTKIHPGLMTKEDLANYDVKRRDPIHGTYRGYDLFSAPPPSSGGSTLFETLNILEHYDLTSKGRTAEGLHLFIEAQKLAFRDRNQMLGDSDFVKIPVEKIISKELAQKHVQEINPHFATPSLEAASRPLTLENTHTTHISIVDEQGNMAAFTTTIEYLFGSGMVVPGYGIVLNNELTDFDLNPRNDKGDIVPNAPAPNKRPRSSMTPTFVFKGGKPVLVLGSPGGSRIIGAVLNIIVNIIDHHEGLRTALEAPRMINRDGPTEMETDFFNNPHLKRDLQRRGHPIAENPAIGNIQAVYFDPETDGFMNGESDPRGEGQALGY